MSASQLEKSSSYCKSSYSNCFLCLKWTIKQIFRSYLKVDEVRSVEPTDPTIKPFFLLSIKEYVFMDYLNPTSTHFNLENNNALQVRIYLCHWHIKIFLLRGVDLCDIIYYISTFWMHTAVYVCIIKHNFLFNTVGRTLNMCLLFKELATLF